MRSIKQEKASKKDIQECRRMTVSSVYTYTGKRVLNLDTVVNNIHTMG